MLKNNLNSLLCALTVTLILLTQLTSQTQQQQKQKHIESILNGLESKRRSQPSDQESAAKSLLNRILPTHYNCFAFQIVPKDVCGGNGCFLIQNYGQPRQNGPEIIIKGTTAVEIASGLHWYLKYWCGAHFSWDKTGGAQIGSIPKPGSLPPLTKEGVVVKRPVPWNYYQNVVTSSYSYVWWDWQRWEKEIDWMALQGINLPLAFTGQESIWQKVFMTCSVKFTQGDHSAPLDGSKTFIKTMMHKDFAQPAFSVSDTVSTSESCITFSNSSLYGLVGRSFPHGLAIILHNFNISVEDLNDFFGGPAFLAWARMGNLHGWGGPLSQNWLDGQLDLQKLILSRMLELGMTPVLPSFSGNVPAALKKTYTSANITRLGNWNTVDGDPRWCCTYLLNPSDPLFVDIGKAFIQQQIKEYGDVTNIYNCDSFNENTPPTDDPKYISLLGAAVYKAMSRGNKDAVWLMQGWLFYSDSTFWKPPQMKALLHSVPLGKMVVLDLFADVKPLWRNSSQFYDTPYIWCMLHNFGGNIEMYGLLDSISSGPVDARSSKNSTMVGVGMCMEGIEHNPVVYELMLEMAFRSKQVQVQEWLKTYAHRRYGKAVRQLDEAWEILYHTIYNCTDGIADHNKDFIVKFPDWDPTVETKSSLQNHYLMQILPVKPKVRMLLLQEKSSDLPQAHLWYSTKEVVNALQLFLDAADDLAGSPTYRYDLVDLTRQVLSKIANQAYLDAVTAYQNKDLKSLYLQSKKFVELIEDIDVLLASNDNFLLGTWLGSAKSLANNPKEMRQYEWNARTQVTMWFDNTNTTQSKLRDYANKFWSGLLKGYYLPRASTYFDYLSKSLEREEDFKLEKWRKEWISYSNKWQEGTEIYPVKAEGDTISISKALYDKYIA